MPSNFFSSLEPHLYNEQCKARFLIDVAEFVIRVHTHECHQSGETKVKSPMSITLSY